MNKYRFVFPAILFLAILLVGCGSSISWPPAPTSIPLHTLDPDQEIINHSLTIMPPENPIQLPAGFGITIFADGLIKPQMMAVGPDEMLYIAEFDTGRILRLPDRDRDGIADGIETAAEEFIDPSSLAFYEDGSMYVAETTRVIRLVDPDGDGYFQEREIIVAGIAAGGHTERTIIFDPDWEHFYLSIGSSCNVCEEIDQRRATVMRFKTDGSEGKIYSFGLRFVVGMAFNPADNALWAANSERDGLGEEYPPDTLFALHLDSNAGWPYCIGRRIVDPDFGEKGSCTGQGHLKPLIEFEAHSTPYGIAFYTGDQFPIEYQQDLFVALHGSREGLYTDGYKIVRIPTKNGELGPIEDFAVGWLLENESHWGTPAGLIVGPDGSLFLSDDTNGTVYKIFYLE